MYKDFFINRNMPPEYAYPHRPLGLAHASLEVNFERFLEWGMGLRNPLKQIPQIGEKLGFGMKVHPLGFTVVYLSEKGRGEMTPCINGIVRANLYPPGVEIQDDIHSHGFDFHSGVIQGELTNTQYFPVWGSGYLPDGEGMVGYEGRVDVYGNNKTVRATTATIPVPRSEAQELGKGDTYTMKPKNYFHAVSVAEGVGTATIFCKTPNYGGSDGISLTLKWPDEEPVPETY
jgi:hypothetical protein